jgi:hypothetical protein
MGWVVLAPSDASDEANGRASRASALSTDAKYVESLLNPNLNFYV